MMDSMMHEKQTSQMGKYKIDIKNQNHDFQKLMNKSPILI